MGEQDQLSKEICISKILLIKIMLNESRICVECFLWTGGWTIQVKHAECGRIGQVASLSGYDQCRV